MISTKTPEEIKIMMEGGKILAKIMKELEKKVRPGITTKELDRAAEALVLRYKGKCSFKGYQGFPACLCVSINEEIVHCLPSNRALREGDIISLDLGILYKGLHLDMAITLPVGKVTPEIQRLIRVTKKALKRAIKKVKPGNTIGDVGNTVQRYVEGQSFNVIRELCGHGIGRKLHEEPEILNYGKRHAGPEIKEGMTFCLEPMVTTGDGRIKKLALYRPTLSKRGGAGAGSKDGYGFQTADNSLSAHFEHTIVVTKNGAKILTVI